MKPQKDYSFIRGVCHNSRVGTEEYLREIGYARSIGVNSFRTWLSYQEWQRDRDAFIENIRGFIRTAYENGITVMPIIFNGNGFAPETLTPEWRTTVGDVYVRDLVTSLKDEPGIIMWDIMNEPSCNDYIMKCSSEERDVRWKLMNENLHHYCGLVKILDPDGTVRDPSVVTAMLGIYRNYSSSRIKPNPNKEGKATEALERLSRAMSESTETFHHKKASSDEILEAAEWIINLLEGSEMVPMYEPPRVKLYRYRAIPEAARDLDEIKDFAYSLAETLRRACRII